MRSPSLTPARACLPVVLATAAQAQTSQTQTPQPSSFAHSVAVSTGVTFTNPFDATASPRPFDGVGTAGSLRYRFDPGTWSFTTEVNGTHARYQPRDDLSG